MASKLPPLESPGRARRTAAVLWLACVGLAGLVATGCADLDDRPASWSYIHAEIIGPSCATSNCHSSLASTAGLRLHTKESAYAYLVGSVCNDEEPPGAADHNFVVPFQPESSKLMYLLRGEEVNRIMPPDVPLPDVEIELIERWILEGAACN